MNQEIQHQATELLFSLENKQARFWLEGETLKFRAPEGVMTPETIAQLKALKPQLIELLKNWQHQRELLIQKDKQNEPFPLSDVQAAYFVGRQSLFEYGGVGCHGYFEILSPHWDADKLERIWNQIIARHGMLRAVVMPNGEQMILPFVEHFAIEQSSQSAESLRETMSHRVYQTDNWPMFDLKVSQANGKACLHFSIDLLIADFLSVQILLAELLNGYSGQAIDQAALEISFRDVIQYQRQQKHGRDYAQSRQYWMNRIADLPACPQLPVLRTGWQGTPQFIRHDCQLSPQQWQELQQICQSQGISPSGLLLTLFSEVIAKWSESRHFSLNLTVMNRPDAHPEIAKLVGDFTSVSLLEVDLRDSCLLRQRVEQIQTQLWQDLEHNAFSGIEVIREWVRQRGKEQSKMPIVFTSALVGEGKTQAQEAMIASQMEIEFSYGISQTPQVWIDCQVMEFQSGLRINWDVLAGIFPADMIETMFAALVDTVMQVITDKAVWQQPLTLPLPQAQQQVRQQVNATLKRIEPDLLHSNILLQAEQTPSAIAVIDAQGTITYAELVDQAQKLAKKLGSQQRHAILMEKGHQQVVAALAILLAGSAYVPVDARQPWPRILQILSDAAINTVIIAGAEEQKNPLTEAGFVVLNLHQTESYPEQTNFASSGAAPQDLAYIIYTSGSTGQPKGVMISHEAACNTICDLQQRIALNASDRMLALARLSFDLSVFDLFGVLGAGGTLILPAEEDLQNPAKWSQLVAQHQITLWNSVPAQMKMLTEYLSAETLIQPSLRYTLLSGDWLPVSLPKVMAQVLPNATQLSLGGATEAAIWSNCWRVDPQEEYQTSIPYGIPLTNQQFRVVDPLGADCPDWVAGELWIGGYGVALGYWQDEEKTERHFLTDTHGERWYRTGDLGRYTRDGVIEFLGRIDHQVKIRGYRVETGEIEALLLKHPQVAQAAVIKSGDKHHAELHAYVEPAKLSPLSPESQQYSHYCQQTVTEIREMAEQVAASLDRELIEKLFSVLDQVALMQMVKALSEMQTLPLHQSVTLDEIMQQGNIAEVNRQLTRRWLRALVQHQYLKQDGHHYQLIQPVSDHEIDDCWQQCVQLMMQLDNDRGLLTYLERSSQCLPELLQGKEDPLNLLFPDGSLDVATHAYQNNLISKFMNRLLLSTAEKKAIEVNQQQNRCLKVLEIGAGVGGTSNVLIPHLAGWNVEYTFTDVSTFFLNEAKKRYQQFDFIHYQLFDFNLSPIEQGLDCGQFDLIISSNVLHNAIVARNGLDHLRQLLAPGGWMLIIEATRDNYQLMTSMEFKHGLTHFADERLELDSPFMPQQNWLNALHDVGGEIVWAYPPVDDALYQMGQSFMLAQFNSCRQHCESQSLLDSLREQLPDYMVPARLAILDALPISANGKWDRKRLPVLPDQVNNKAEISSPQTDDPLEMTLLTLCREVIGNAAMGIDDDFFTSGGDSLLITQWINRIRETLGADQVPWEGSLRQVLQQPTVRALAAYLRSQSEQQETQNRACTRIDCLKEGDGEPVIILHEGSGTVLPYLPLVEKLSGPVYGLSIGNIETFLSIPADNLIPQLAANYLKEIQAIWPQCHLVGYCMGGLLTFEIARQAMESLTPVKSVTIVSSYQIPYRIEDSLMIDMSVVWALGIESPWPLDKSELDAIYEEILAEKPDVITHDAVFQRASANGLHELATAYAQVQQRSDDQRLSQLLAAIGGKNATASDVSQTQWKQMCEVFRHSIRGVCGYQPEYYAGDMTFACQQGNTYLLPSLQQDMKTFWQTYCIGDVTYLNLNGDHFNCMKASNIPPLVQHIEQGKQGKIKEAE
ncbi:non-ribosomal peptide synthetase [Xenorhabdus lircayensis]|uniref:Amino acid adenylation domain-containing protein n=1 Tax=Xenorhabdus lircayensis TaxID=2763499 RepID=A0ABS0U7Y5_9GAMM|nr:non-ribosomal peptide synthetase [Xenorhabdus lircayensis]MBI6549624.1 amino acid adenylation domain-containing protein [Xenorhabdus lircayensis]